MTAFKAEQVANKYADAFQKAAVSITLIGVFGGLTAAYIALKKNQIHAAREHQILAEKTRRILEEIPQVRTESSMPYGPYQNDQVYRLRIPKEIAGTALDLKCIQMKEGISCDWEGAKGPATLKLTGPQ